MKIFLPPLRYFQLSRSLFLQGFFIVLSVLSSRAQGVDLRGVVTDSTTGERIPFANIIIRGTVKGASTNLNGFFIITNVSRGSYEIVASAVGFQREVKKVNVQGWDYITVNFQLVQRTVEVEEVVVEAERRLEKLDAASIHVLSPQDIQEIPYSGQADVFRSLLILPGIVSTSDVSSKFYVRGGAGDQNLILLDGMKMYNPFHAFGVFSVFDPDLINTTEVFTGAFPAGYGNRLSSVVNMTTKQGNTTRLAGKGELNFLSGKLQLEGPIGGDNSWIANGRTSLFDGSFKHFLKSSPPISFYDLFLKATIGNETGRNSFRGFFSGDKVTSDKIDEPDHEWTTQAMAVSLSGLASDRIYVDGVAYTSSFKVRRDAKQSTVVTPAESHVGDDGLRVDATIYTESSGTFLTGFQFDLPDYEFTYSTRSNAQRTFKSVDPELWLWFRHLMQYRYSQTDFGIHIDLISLFQKGVSLQGLQPRLSVQFTLAELWRVRLSYGAFNQRVITISNEDDITSLFEAWIAIPEYLQPQEAHHFVVGVEGILSDRFSLGAQLYYKHYPSLVLYNREKFFPTDPDYLNGTGKASGVEFLARFGSSFADLYLAYSLGRTSVTSSGLTYAPRYDRRHTINALGVFHPLENLEVSVRWEFGTGFPYTQTVGYYDRLLLGGIGGAEQFTGESGLPYSILGEKNAVRLPTYYRIDASVTYRFAVSNFRGSLGISVANMTNRKNILFYPNGPYKQKLVVYGVFSSQTDTQYVRVYSTYPLPGSPTAAGVSDAVVIVTQGPTVYRFRDTTLQGVNASGAPVPIPAFVTYSLRPVPATGYDLSVVSPTQGSVRSHAAGLYKGRLFTTTNPQGDISVQVVLGANVRAYIVRMFVTYTVRVESVWVNKRTEVPTLVTSAGEFIYPKPIGGQLRSVSFSGGAYLALTTFLRSQYPTGVRLNKTVFILTELDDALYAYYSTANGFPDSGTLRLDEPDYTNIEGGLGIFGMTSESVFEADTTGNPFANP